MSPRSKVDVLMLRFLQTTEAIMSAGAVTVTTDKLKDLEGCTDRVKEVTRRRGNNLKCFEDFGLEARARIRL